MSSSSVIRVVAPSGAFDRERFDRGLEWLERAGFKPRYDDSIFSRERYLAGSDEIRLGGVRAALADPEADALWFARGGYGAGRIVGRLDRWPEKWLVGFSDATAFHLAASGAGVCSVHGANVTTLDSWTEEHRAELFAMLTGELRTQRFEGTVQGTPGASKGVLRGGNLTVLASMVGSSVFPSFDEAIVLLEDVGESPYRLDRVLNQLRQSGAFDGVRGFVVGQLSRCSAGENADFSALDVVLEGLTPYGVPIVTGLPLGHDADSRAVWLEANATIDQGRLEVTLPLR
ncbi:MAG: LD-carboxypeptidase [Myxococcota bacterium]